MLHVIYHTRDNNEIIWHSPGRRKIVSFLGSCDSDKTRVCIWVKRRRARTREARCFLKGKQHKTKLSIFEIIVCFFTPHRIPFHIVLPFFLPSKLSTSTRERKENEEESREVEEIEKIAWKFIVGHSRERKVVLGAPIILVVVVTRSSER